MIHEVDYQWDGLIVTTSQIYIFARTIRFLYPTNIILDRFIMLGLQVNDIMDELGPIFVVDGNRGVV